MKVVVGMSGGVDSSIAAYLLKKEGYEVQGVFYRLFKKEAEELSRCCNLDSAIISGKTIGIPVEVVDVSNEFENEVIKYFIDSYKNGLTPNPCTVCNERIKFGIGFKKAKEEFNGDYFATGHYAIVEITDSEVHLRKGLDEDKDQSYMLWRLDKDSLRRVIFPLGKMRKTKVIEIAKKLGIPSGKESEDLCFIRTNLKDFLEEHLKVKTGKILDTSGRELGEHRGAHFYTIGQRSGLNISYKKPLYVISINTDTNTVVLGTKDECMFRGCEIKELNVIEKWSGERIELEGKVRYRSPLVKCSVESKNGRVFVDFSSPQFAVTPGQSLVLYNGDIVYMGGVIEKVFR